MPRAISSTAIAPCACASRIKDGRAKNSARPRRGRSIRSIRAGFELFGAFLSLPTQLPKLLAQLWVFEIPWTIQRRQNGSKPARKRQAVTHTSAAPSFSPYRPGAIRAASPSKAWQHPSLVRTPFHKFHLSTWLFWGKSSPPCTVPSLGKAFLLAFSTLALKVCNPRHV